MNHVYNKAVSNQTLNMINLTSGGEIKINDKFKIESHFGLSRRTAPQVWVVVIKIKGIYINW
ncbi:hypothetical protein CS542_02265 [Pedobacter sp. IW39]|nr:hypothetical protein CS542_02265 [Pedobacter sp. IW39]